VSHVFGVRGGEPVRPSPRDSLPPKGHGRGAGLSRGHARRMRPGRGGRTKIVRGTRIEARSGCGSALRAWQRSRS
jgi:hypothetical protein